MMFWLKEDAKQLKFTVADDGVGYNIKEAQTGVFGTKLINALTK